METIGNSKQLYSSNLISLEDNSQISNIEEVITDWYFTNNDEMDMIGLEFLEVTKNTSDDTFAFNFNRNGKLWHLKYEFQTYFFECNDAEHQDAVERCNDAFAELDEETEISQMEPSAAVLKVLEDILLKQLMDIKKGVDGDEEMEEEADPEEEEDVAGWSDEDYEMPDTPVMEKNSSSLNNQINKHHINLGTRDSIQLFSKLRVLKEAKETQSIIETFMTQLPEVFQIQIFEPLLMFKLTIDLSFMSVEPHTYKSLGFNMEELVEYLFIFEDNKLLMFLDDPSIYDKSIEEMCKLGILKIEFQQQSNDSLQTRYQSYLQLLHESFFSKNSEGVSHSEELKDMDDQDLEACKSTLLEMGFNSSEAENALREHKFSVQGAIDWLVGKKKDKKDRKEEISDETADIDPKQMLFSNITGKQLKNNTVLNYFRYLIYGLDSILSNCCICREKLPHPSTKIKC